uniref:glycosyltransferase n=1 Tax=Candidatus Electronema sp. TaxID=2698783 RepID=UPI004057830A
MPELSVIIPAWNAAKNLPLCLEALERQTVARDRFEVIVVDDGSSDQTAEIASRCAVRCHSQENQGPAAARNQGAALAQGSLIFFTDADCVPDLTWLEEMAAPFARPDVAAVKGAYRTEQTSLVARFAQLEFEERFRMLARRDSIDMVDTYSAGFKKDVFQKLGGFDTHFPEANNEDTEFSYRMAEAGHRMVFAPKAVVRHLNHPDSVHRYFRLKFGRGYWRMMVYQLFPGKMLKDSYTPQTLKLQILALLGAGAGLLALPCLPRLGAAAIAAALLSFLALTIPFAAAAFKRDRIAALLSPLLLALRAAAIGSGAIWGVARLMAGRKFESPA